VPEPTVRQYDRWLCGQDIQYTALEAMPPRRPRARKSCGWRSKGLQPSSNAFLRGGVDPANGKVDRSLHTLLHFDKEGNRARPIKSNAARSDRSQPPSRDNDRLLIGSDPAGHLEFARPDKKNSEIAAVFLRQNCLSSARILRGASNLS